MRKRFALFAACVVMVTCVCGQRNKASFLYRSVAENKSTLRKVSLFTETDTIAEVNRQAKATVSAFAALKLSLPAVLDIAASKPEGLQVEIPFGRYKNFNLRLVKQRLNTNGNFSFGTLQGDHVKTPLSGEAGVHYRGYIDGDSTSMATISFFKDGSLMALFANSNGNFIVGKVGNDKNNYIVYNDRNMKMPQQIRCATSDAHVYGRPHMEGAPTPPTPQNMPPTLCNKLLLYWEGDFELYNYNFNNNLNATQNYMEGLFNEVAAMYQNEGIVAESAGMFVWTTADPYRNNSSTNGLTDFQAFWNAKNDDFGGDLAHLVAGGRTNNGGLAYVLGGLCGSKSFSYAYSNVWGEYNSIPTFSWDVEVITHETGHNLGSRHTQWCGWNTGPNGTCGAIDNCYTLESYNNCSTCPSTTDTAQLPEGWQGTVMSYCHLSEIGINLANGFGPLPQEVIRNVVAGSSCLRSLIAATATPQAICNTNDGAVMVSFDNNNLGTAPYSYLWTPGNYTTQDISSLSTPGLYSVTITDNANCTAQLFAEVEELGNPGTLVPLTIAQPVCCGPGDDSITLKTESPKILDDCETVGWVRSKTPLSTFEDVRNAYASATTNNLFFSSNQNTRDSAILKIKPPVTCASDSTWYYAAFISKKKAESEKLSSASVYLGFVTGNDGTNIGSYHSVPNQNSAINACQRAEVPLLTFAVEVTAYTGRANELNIEVQDANGNYITGLFNLKGTGTYNLPAGAFRGIELDKFFILAYDFNCTSTSCVTSSVTFKATRVVTYPAIDYPTLEDACSAAAANKITFSSNTAQCTVLAVDFSNFKAVPNNCSVEVSWQTTNEAGNSFVIERSTDAQVFVPVATVAPKGGVLNYYNYTDNLAATGKNYYRVKETDGEGRVTYTQARMVELSCSGNKKISLYPNPAHTEVFLRSTQAIRRVEVVNNAGQVLMKASEVNYQAGVARLNVSRLLAGVYICKITLADGSVENVKFVKH